MCSCWLVLAQRISGRKHKTLVREIFELRFFFSFQKLRTMRIHCFFKALPKTRPKKKKKAFHSVTLHLRNRTRTFREILHILSGEKNFLIRNFLPLATNPRKSSGFGTNQTLQLDTAACFSDGPRGSDCMCFMRACGCTLINRTFNRTAETGKQVE